jgi:hypothetical protein
MPNTFTTNYSLEKSEIGGDNSQWGSRIHTAFDTTDAQLINKLDKDNVKGFTSTAIIFTNTGASTGTISAASGDLFEDFEVNDKIKVSGATSATNGSTASPAEHTITAKTNSNSITVSTGLVDASAGDSVTITLVTEIGRVDINSGTIDGATIATSDITVGSGKTLDVSGGTFGASQTTTAQKDAIVDGSTAITRSTNDLTFAGNVDVTGDLTVNGNDIKSTKGVTSISIDAGGTGYTAGTLSASGGGGSNFSGTYTVSGLGVIDSVTITEPGSGFTSAPTIIPSDGGSGATLTPTISKNTAITFSGRNTTLAGTTNNVGTVTAGTIDHTVTMTGVPRRKKIKILSGSQYTTDTSKVVSGGSISYPVVSGRTYLITACYNQFTQGGSSGSYTSAYYGIAYSTSSRGNHTVVSDTDLQTIDVRYMSTGAGEVSSVHATNIGAYTYSGASDTHYAYVWMQRSTNSTSVGATDIVITVEEFDSDNLE